LEGALATALRETSDDPRLPPLVPLAVPGPEPSVVVLSPAGAAVVVVAPVDLGRPLAAVLGVVTGSDPADVLTVVGVAEVAGRVLTTVVVGTGPEEVWGGGTSVEALQICAYEGVTDGGGSLGLAGSADWNLSPTTSSEGLETDCSAGPLLAYTHDPEDPCQ
jgi:hypothetical protein